MKFPIKLKTSEVLFIISALAMLIAQPILGEEAGFLVWTGGKVLYFVGLLYFGYNFVIKKDTHAGN